MSDNNFINVGAMTGSAAGALAGGAIGGLAAEANWIGKKDLRKRHLMALLLAGSMAGAATGANLGGRDFSIPTKVKKANLYTEKLAPKHIWNWIRGNTFKEMLQQERLRKRILKGSDATERYYNSMQNLGPKTAAYVSHPTMNRIVSKLVGQEADGKITAEQRAARVKRLVNKETAQNIKYKWSPKHQLGRLTDKYIGDVSEVPARLRKAPAAVGKALLGVAEGIVSAKAGDFIVSKMTKKPTLVQQAISAAPKYIAGAAAVAGGTYLANRLSDKTAAPKFNPSVLGESVDDIFDVWVMYKAQERMQKREQERLNAQQPTTEGKAPSSSV